MSRTVSGKYCAVGNTEKSSCYSREQLVNIARAAGIAPSNKSKDQLWREIDEKMKSTCSTEWCWLDRLNIRDDSAFMPRGTAGRYEWLSSLDIKNVMTRYEKYYPEFMFLGPVSIDFCNLTGNEVCNLNLSRVHRHGRRCIGIVFNTDPSDKPGRHWICMFIDMRGNRRNWSINYFDSFGQSRPPKEIVAIVKKYKAQIPEFKVNMNCAGDVCTDSVRQQQSNTECGVYCINFIVKRLTGRTWEQILAGGDMDDATINQSRKKFFRPSGQGDYDWY
jgi:hypothetical protein